MSERKTIRKWFWVWDFEKEERWLNEMALQGWALDGVGWCTYHFRRCEPGEYTVRLEMRTYDESYVAFMEETGAEFVGRRSWVPPGQKPNATCCVGIGAMRMQRINLSWLLQTY